MGRVWLLTFVLLAFVKQVNAQSILLEAESFQHKGGWVVDQQFMDLMGSSYLMAHGIGIPVEDAICNMIFPKKGEYYVYVRTFNWTSPWHNGKGPGKFMMTVNDKIELPIAGDVGNQWMWQSLGSIKVPKGQAKITLRDITGFNGRCDAIYFTTRKGDVPPSKLIDLAEFRKRHLKHSVVDAGEYDLIVVGAGVAGMCAAASASRLGCKVALLNDRPVLGGNNSSEIRVHLGGGINVGRYKELGNLIKEFGPVRAGNAQPADYYEDAKKEAFIASEKNITLFSNFRALQVQKSGSQITAVVAKHIETGEEKMFRAPLFVDCTGDGTIGYLAGADYAMGREARDEFNESLAPEVADKMTMGASAQWYSKDTDAITTFPVFEYGIKFADESCERVTMGEWTWETGMNYDQISDFERIRDYGLLVIYSNWSYLKNRLVKNEAFRNRDLDWVAYLSGKRESRRLLGDYILKEDDIRKEIKHEDGTAASTWSIDLHYPDPNNTKHFPGEEFKSIANHVGVPPYPIPYRCLYSRNVNNLFMAGRNISVTHVALGTTRVMRTTGMIGEVVGMAAWLCKSNSVSPRDIYRYHLPELKTLMNQGTGKKGLPNNQRYN